jgi:hypothetical protein
VSRGVAQPGRADPCFLSDRVFWPPFVGGAFVHSGALRLRLRSPPWTPASGASLRPLRFTPLSHPFTHLSPLHDGGVHMRIVSFP